LTFGCYTLLLPLLLRCDVVAFTTHTFYTVPVYGCTRWLPVTPFVATRFTFTVWLPLPFAVLRWFTRLRLHARLRLFTVALPRYPRCLRLLTGSVYVYLFALFPHLPGCCHTTTCLPFVGYVTCYVVGCCYFTRVAVVLVVTLRLLRSLLPGPLRFTYVTVPVTFPVVRYV